MAFGFNKHSVARREVLGITYGMFPRCFKDISKGQVDVKAEEIVHMFRCERFTWCVVVCDRSRVECKGTHVLQRPLSRHKLTLCGTSQSTHRRYTPSHPPAQTCSIILLTLEVSFNKMYNSIKADKRAEGPLNSLKSH